MFRYSRASIYLVLLSYLFIPMGVYANDLNDKDLESILMGQIAELQSKSSDSKRQGAPKSENNPPDKDTPKKTSNEKRENLFGRGGDTVSPAEYSNKVENIVRVLKQLDNPKLLMEAMVSEGQLELSLNDIYLLRLIVDELEKAKNANLVNPNIINDEYMIDHADRYKMYDIFIHESGETLVEFLDFNGDPWPIFDHSDSKGFDIRKGENHMLWISNDERHRMTNLFVTLEKYTAPIQFNLIYSNDSRHGLATYKLPFVSPTSQSASNQPVDSSQLMLSNIQSNEKDGESLGFDTKSLSYLASTGRFHEDSLMAKEAQLVMVSDSSLAQIWHFNSKFIIRTSYQMASFDHVVQSAGPMKVYVNRQLNSIVPLSRGGVVKNLIIPNYHQYETSSNNHLN